jgi:hypothetical protein
MFNLRSLACILFGRPHALSGSFSRNLESAFCLSLLSAEELVLTAPKGVCFVTILCGTQQAIKEVSKKANIKALIGSLWRSVVKVLQNNSS